MIRAYKTRDCFCYKKLVYENPFVLKSWKLIIYHYSPIDRRVDITFPMSKVQCVGFFENDQVVQYWCNEEFWTGGGGVNFFLTLNTE